MSGGNALIDQRTGSSKAGTAAGGGKMRPAAGKHVEPATCVRAVGHASFHQKHGTGSKRVASHTTEPSHKPVSWRRTAREPEAAKMELWYQNMLAPSGAMSWRVYRYAMEVRGYDLAPGRLTSVYVAQETVSLAGGTPVMMEVLTPLELEMKV